jgi:hypothetical protein
MELTISDRLLKALHKVDRPLEFCVSGKLPLAFPALVAAGKPISLPLDDRHAATLKKLARQAPFGKGSKTLVDTKVRRVWEIDGADVEFANPGWSEIERFAVAAAQVGLGLGKQKLSAHLYKLLLYEKGSFFVSHRDSEKLDRMVGTLIISLPSAHRGGALVVRHEGNEKIVDFGGPESAFEIRYAAFYADCEHEVRPLTIGHRLVLAYNLTLSRSKKGIEAPTVGSHVEAVARLLAEEIKSELIPTSPREPSTDSPNAADAPLGSDDEDDAADEDEEEDFDEMPFRAAQENAPTKLAVLLDHAYTETGLTPDALKGTDRARAEVLFAAAQRSGFDAALALVTYHKSGSTNDGEAGYGWSGGWSGAHVHEEDESGDEDWEMDEVYDETLVADRFVDGNQLDSTHVTDRKGSLYVLVLKKTTGSFERAKKVHKQDVEDLATIAELGKWHRGLGQ